MKKKIIVLMASFFLILADVAIGGPLSRAAGMPRSSVFVLLAIVVIPGILLLLVIHHGPPRSAGNTRWSRALPWTNDLPLRVEDFETIPLREVVAYWHSGKCRFTTNRSFRRILAGDTAHLQISPKLADLHEELMREFPELFERQNFPIGNWDDKCLLLSIPSYMDSTALRRRLKIIGAERGVVGHFLSDHARRDLVEVMTVAAAEELRIWIQDRAENGLPGNFWADTERFVRS